MARVTARLSRRVILFAGLAVGIVILGIVGLGIWARRGAPPDDLSVTEAVDLASFEGWTVNGTPAFLQDPKDVLVADLSFREAGDFLRQEGIASNLPTAGLEGFLGRTFVVVARGTVASGPEADAASRGNGMALVVDHAGTVQLVAIGPPWDTAVPPNARSYPVPDEPRLANVSRARARIALDGKPLIELAHPPGGLSLTKLAINLDRLPVDPSGTEFPGRTVTLIYADNTGRPRLWLTEATTGDDPRVLGRPVPLQKLQGGVTPYAWHAGTWEIDGFAWRRSGRAMFLTAEPGDDLPLESITAAVESLTDPAAPGTPSIRS